MVSETLAETKAGWKMWNPDEQIAVAHKAIERMIELKCTKFPSYGAHSTTRCVDWAQREVLPKGRHRWLSEFMHVQKSGIVPVMEQLWKEHMEGKAIPSAEEVPDSQEIKSEPIAYPVRKPRVQWRFAETENLMALAVKR